LGGYVGVSVSPPFFESPDQVKEAVDLISSIPFEGRVGAEGIAIGTDFMGVDRTLPGLGNVTEVIAWVQAKFDRPTAKRLLLDNGLALIARTTGVHGT
jgi:membrane dipeptidase